MIPFAIAAAFGGLAALFFSKSWLSSLIIGAFFAMPWGIFNVYMLSGGLTGVGFDASKLPEGTSSLLEFGVLVTLMMMAAGAIAGIVGRGVRRLISR